MALAGGLKPFETWSVLRQARTTKSAKLLHGFGVRARNPLYLAAIAYLVKWRATQNKTMNSYSIEIVL